MIVLLFYRFCYVHPNIVIVMYLYVRDIDLPSFHDFDI